MTGDKLFLMESRDAQPPTIVRTKRIGVDYAGSGKTRCFAFMMGEAGMFPGHGWAAGESPED